MRGRTVGNLTRCGEDFDSPATTPIRHDVAARDRANGERAARSGRGVAGIANGVCSSRRTANLISRVPANVSHKTCRTCGSSLDLEAPSGFCPACLFQTALNPEGEEAESAGARFTDFEIVEEVARGGMDIVYRRSEERRVGKECGAVWRRD